MATVTNDELVRYLTSAANYESEGTGYYLHTKGGNLTEKLFDGAEWSLPVQIGASKGPAAYVAGKSKRVVFTIDPAGKLQNYIYNPDEDSWEQGKVSSAIVHPHAHSNVTATIENGKPHVYFQNSSGALQELNTEDGDTWHDGGAISAGKPIVGSALSNIVVGDGIYVFYQHEDSSIHYLVKDNKKGSWTDKQVNNGQVTGTVTRFITTGPSDKGEFDVYYFTKEGHIVHISPEEKREIGTLDADGNFKASTSAECWSPCPPCCWPPPPPICWHQHHCCW